MAIFLITGRVNEDGSATLMARVAAADGTGATIAGEGKMIKQADLATISYAVFDLSGISPGTAIITGIAAIGTTIFDTLQLDSIWGADLTGYNFKHQLAPAAFPTGSHRYRIEYLCTTNGGTVFWVKAEVDADNVYTS